MSCKGEIPKEKLLDYIAKNPGCSRNDVAKEFSLTDIKTVGQRLNRMSERGEIRREFGAHGSRNYYPITVKYEPVWDGVKHGIESIFDYA